MLQMHRLMASMAVSSLLSGIGATGVARAAPPTIVSFNATLSDTNLVTLAWSTQGGDPSNLLYIYDVGFRSQNGSEALRVASPGVYRYTLAVRNAANERATRQVEVDVPPLPHPTLNVTSPNPVYFDFFNVGTTTITWTAADGGFVRLRKPLDNPFLAPEELTTGFHVVTPSQLRQGMNQYGLAYCRRTTSNPEDPAFCSGGVSVTVFVGGARFAGPPRVQLPAGQAATVSWTGPSGPGYSWRLRAPTLGIAQLSTTAMSHTFPSVVAGVHEIELSSCFSDSAGSRCADREDVLASTAGVLSAVSQVGDVTAPGSLVARIDTGSSIVDVRSQRTGRIGVLYRGVGFPVTAGMPIAGVYTEDLDRKQLVVGSSVAWTTRSWSSDFTSGASDRFPLWKRSGAIGVPLDVLVASDGDIWSIGELHQSVAHVAGSTLTHHEVPLLMSLNSITGLMEKAKPFALDFGAGPAPSAISLFGERIIEGGGAIWFAQGGYLAHPSFSSLNPPSVTVNHSRIVRFDPQGTDSQATEQDDRFCIYNVPSSLTQVIGLAWDDQDGRLWFTESFMEGDILRNSLSSFRPSELECRNFVDFSAPASVPHYPVCTTGVQTGCVRRVPLADGKMWPAHLVVDRPDGAIWFTEFLGDRLARYDLDNGSLRRFPTVPVHRTGTNVGVYGAAPFQIRVDDDYVYFIEWQDADVVRFDKSQRLSRCEKVANAASCMEEVHLPVTSNDLYGHSIELHDGKLWFTLFDAPGTDPFATNASGIGSIDVDTWQSGVLYADLGSLAEPARSSLGPAAFAGISISPGGDIVLADFFRQHLLRLRPNP